MIPLGNGQNPLGIMKSVKIGPQMDQRTYELIRKFNSGWINRNEPEYQDTEKLVASYAAFLGNVFVQVKLKSKQIIKDFYTDDIYFAADVYPVCRSVEVRETLLHTLDRLVSQRNANYAIYEVHGL